MQDKAKIQLAYGLYLAVSPALAYGPYLAVFPAIVGFGLAYTQRNRGNAFVASHCRFQIRTFWIGLLYLGLSTLLVGLLPGGMYLLLFPAFWWFIRCVKGILDTVKDEPVQNEETWLF